MRRTEEELNRGPSAYQPNALLPSQAGSQGREVSNLVFYAQSTSTVISGRMEENWRRLSVSIAHDSFNVNTQCIEGVVLNRKLHRLRKSS